MQNCFEQQYELEDLHWKGDCKEVEDNILLLKDHPSLASVGSHIMVDLNMKDSHLLAIYFLKSNFCKLHL